jgi:hypothetical protein
LAAEDDAPVHDPAAAWWLRDEEKREHKLVPALIQQAEAS